jgi:beta-galactosidase
MRKIFFYTAIAFAACFFSENSYAQRKVQDFDKDWKFYYADTTDLKTDYKNASFDDSRWRSLNLPHDYSIEQEFKKDAPAKPDGGALPGGIGWYRKIFMVPTADRNKNIFIEFDGVYRYSEVWINDHYLGLRPSGYISFRYDLAPYLKFGEKNSIAVKVDNSKQPNSRWYSGSGIYRDVRLVTTNKIAVSHWGTFITSSNITNNNATVTIDTRISNTSGKKQNVSVTTIVLNREGKEIGRKISTVSLSDTNSIRQVLSVANPQLWSVDRPYLYKAVSTVTVDGTPVDEYVTRFGIRYFDFHVDKGFSLNGKPLKILGVCNHHDLGCLGAAFNARAAERQLELLKSMGCNAIRTSHNPPDPKLLDLCDQMGFLVMDEAFDMWKQRKSVAYGYYLDWNEWHKQDLEDQVLRDRNHPSVFVWSIGNEIPEQTKAEGGALARELAAIVRNLDTTRPITTANNAPGTNNMIIKEGGLDLVGYNYSDTAWPGFPQRYPGKKFIGTETTSALETRGYYQMPSDSLFYWPYARVNGQRVNAKMNEDHTVSAYDHVRAPWASTHEESWKIIKKYDFLSGMFIWTGFDYLGEPTPYGWPSRSSYFGIIDLAGFPKDVYYMYQSEWTNKPVLHIYPHWNWKKGDSVDVWAYYNNADEVELFLNGRSLGAKRKTGDDLHVWWRILYEPGTVTAVSKKAGKTVLTRGIHTAGKAAKIELIADRKIINADGKDLSFVTVRITDANGNLVPDADNLVRFAVQGDAFIAGVDNGDPVSHEPFKASYRKAFYGLALAVVQSKEKKGKVTLTATADGLQNGSVTIELK